MSAAPKVLLVAEGPSEFGELDQPAEGRRRRRREGYFAPMLRKLVGKPLEITAQKVTNIGKFEAKPALRGHADKAAKALTLALALEYDVVVFVKDVDRAPGTKRSALERGKRLKEIHEEIEAGFAAVAGADAVARVKATPCRMVEAWAVGDRDALDAVDAADPSAAPARPEELWGDEADPKSNHPKCVLRRALGEDAHSGWFEEIAHESSPATLRKSCPESFAPFADEVELAAKTLASR